MSGNTTRPSEAGLPDAQDYNPDANLAAQGRLGDPEYEAPEYGLHTRPVLINDEDTGRRALLRNGEFIAYVSSQYQPLPNEEAVSAANAVADDLGLVPFHEWERPDEDGWFIELDDHVYQDPERRRVHALYAFESGTIGGDEMEYGVAVHNSIDTSLSFKVALFTYRHACANMVNIGVGNARDRLAQNVEDERGVEHATERVHTSGFDVSRDALQARIKSTIFFVDNVQDAYQEWVQQEVDWTMVDSLLRNHPDSDLPEWMGQVSDDFEDVLQNDDLQGSGNPLTPEKKADIVQARRPKSETVWSAYNSITENIWHSDNKDTTKQTKFRRLHATMDPLATVGDE